MNYEWKCFFKMRLRLLCLLNYPKRNLIQKILAVGLVVLVLGGSAAYTQIVKKDSQQIPTSIPDFNWWNKAQQYQKRFHKGNPNRPAVLLFHGLHQSLLSWTKPSLGGYNYDYSHAPDKISATKDSPGLGIFKVGKSDLMSVDQNNWFDFLVGQGFTVATWSQPGETVGDAYPSAVEVFERFVKDTEALNPASPPPIALIAHSRGGLLVRKLLKEKGDMGRVRWVVTLHSPHAGSEMARAPARLAAEITDLIDGVPMPPGLKGELKNLAVEAARPLNKFIEDGSRELVPDGPLMRSLRSGEQPIPGVKYYTFGGVNPNLYRLYAWMFTPGSIVPQFRRERLKLVKYYKWEAKPVEIILVSPILDKVRDFAPEIKPGSGDALVTDASARLPHLGALHQTTQLHHAEVLWNRGLQQKVVQILSGLSAPVKGHPFPGVKP